jgi:C1A family cysteine protease
MPALPAKDSDWNPPKSAINYRATVTHTLIKPTAIIEVLDQDRACILTMNITRSFYTPDNEGVVAAVNGDPLTGCHAVVAIGYGSLNGNMMLLVRNSWGVDWGLRGYGWLHQEYVTTNLRSVSTIAAIY